MIRLLLFLGVFLALSVPSVSGANSAATKPKLIVGGDHDCPPYEFLENGMPTGFDVELMRAVAEVMGLDVEFRLGQWSKVRQELEQGRIDALAGMYYSADRSRFVDFSVPHTMVTSGIFVRDDSPIRSYADMQGKEIIVQEGDIIHDSMRRNGLASRIVAVADAGEALKLLASGKHDCAVMPSRLQGEYYVKAFGLTNIRFVDTELPQQWYCFAVRKGNQELLSKLDEGLKILKVTGKYRAIHEKWFGVYEKRDLWNAVRYYVLAIALVAVLCLVFLVWSRMLKRQVAARTAELRRSEEELRFSESRYRALHRDNPTMIFTLDADGTVLSVNKSGANKLGYSIEELEGQPVLTVFHEEDRPAVSAQLQECLRYPNKVYSWQFRKIHKDGSLLWVEELAQAVYDLNGVLNVLIVCQDVTERKQAEEQLRFTQFAVDNSIDQAFWMTEDGRLFYVNDSACRALGYSREELIGMSVPDIDPTYPPEVFAEHWRNLREHGSVTMESLHRAKDGSVYPVEIRANYVVFDGREYNCAFATDISERKRMEEELECARDDLEKRVEERTAELARTTAALTASEKEKSLILNITDAHVIYYDLDMNILWANKAAADSVNMVPEELQMRHCWEVWHQRREPCAGCPVLSARDTGNPQEAEIRTPDGRVWFIRAYPVRNETGRIIGVVEFTQDFTERKEIEIELRKNKEKYQAIVDQIDGYIYIASGDYRIQFMNESVGKLFGYSEPGEFCYEVMHDRDSACPDCRSEEVFEGKTVRREWFNPKNGRFYHVTDTPIFHDDGTIVRQTVATDITERKLAEELLEQRKRQLEELNCTLEKRVEEEVAKNREKDVILIQQNRRAAMGEMLDHIAHQWKQPLNAISFIVQDAEAAWDCGEMTDEYMYETVTKTTDLVQHMAQTIEVFRDFYRAEKEKTAFSIKDSLDKALSFISPVLRFHAIELGLDVDPGLTAIGYPKEYAQVLLNIMTNARDVFVERKTEMPRLEVKAFKECARAVVTITDNAGGIPDTIIDKVFDIYFTTRESSGGTGVGLYMSKNIIEKNMGGKLSVANIDAGARFRIELDVLQ